MTTRPWIRIPIYARGGAVIPCGRRHPHSTNGYQPRVVELHLFVPASDGVYHSMLQEDDGLSFAALQDGRYRTTFTVARAGADLTLNADVSGNGYLEFARERFALVLHGTAPEEARLDDVMIIGSDGRFEIPNEGGGFSFSCTVSGGAHRLAGIPNWS